MTPGSNSCELERRDLMAMSNALRSRGGGPFRRGRARGFKSAPDNSYGYNYSSGYGFPNNPVGHQGAYGGQGSFGPAPGGYGAGGGPYVRGGPANRVPPTGESALLQLLLQQVSKGSVGKAASSSNKEGCYACGDMSHWARNCPQKR